ncbi:MAG TPA: type II toxin-antitoxin system HicA family toxin [Terriglobia bacterium]|nr:type II toxin-antitoxin system HicA family toxin [Terriglobia bacterium]
MAKLKRLSGDEVIRIFRRLGFDIVGQRGSHVKLRRISAEGDRQSLTIPWHSELDKGTVRAIYRQALAYVADDVLRPDFYIE